MSVAVITRTAWTDDDGTGTTGTIINNAVKTELYNQIDALIVAEAAAMLATVNVWSAKQSFSVAPMVPASGGTGIFGLDCTDTAGVSVVNNGIITPFSNANNFSGLILVCDTTGTGECALFMNGIAMVLISQTGATFSATPSAAGKSSVYRNAGVVTLENKTGSTLVYRILGIRVRIAG